jgi:hypothetical protein
MDTFFQKLFQNPNLAAKQGEKHGSTPFHQSTASDIMVDTSKFIDQDKV